MPEPVTAAIMAGSAALGAGVSLFGANKAADATATAAKKQLKATKLSIAAQKEALDKQIALSEPYRVAGQNALAGYQTASPYTPFGMDQFNADPGYQFRLAEGTKALERSAAARGILQSGGTLKDITRFGQDQASNEYQNAFSRYLQEREQKLHPLEYQIGLGQAAATGQAAQIGNSANTISGLTQQMGDVRAQNAMTQGNIWNQTAGNIGNTLTGAANAYGQYQAAQPYMNYLQSITPSTSVY